jgi:hypothetical protein
MPNNRFFIYFAEEVEAQGTADLLEVSCQAKGPNPHSRVHGPECKAQNVFCYTHHMGSPALCELSDLVSIPYPIPHAHKCSLKDRSEEG